MTNSAATGSRVEVRQVDITTLSVDAIVNAANARMLGGGGVDGAIHRAAGPELVEECRAVSETRPGVRCPTGEARLTRGYKLPAKHVIHTVGPIWYGGTRGEPELLASCYSTSMQLAVDKHIMTIAFPAISCGAYGYPLEQAARVAAHEVAQFLVSSSFITKVVFAAFDTAVEDALAAACSAESLENTPGSVRNSRHNG
jgi:O-acetyl-ADP-ribose deacetylase (regulator of RNase III)